MSTQCLPTSMQCSIAARDTHRGHRLNETWSDTLVRPPQTTGSPDTNPEVVTRPESTIPDWLRVLTSTQGKKTMNEIQTTCSFLLYSAQQYQPASLNSPPHAHANHSYPHRAQPQFDSYHHAHPVMHILSMFILTMLNLTILSVVMPILVILTIITLPSSCTSS